MADRVPRVASSVSLGTAKLLRWLVVDVQTRFEKFENSGVWLATESA
jgi:hypothetical protein